MRQLSAADWDRNRRSAAPPARTTPSRSAERARPPAPKAPEPRPEGKVVATAPGNGERPDASKFLSETDNRDEKETVSRHRRADYQNLAPRPSGPSPTKGERESARAAAEPPAGNGGSGLDERPQAPGSAASPAVEIPKQAAREERRRLSFEGLSGVPLRFQEERYAEAIAGNSDRLRLTPGQSGAADDEEGEASLGMRGRGRLSTLMPSAAVLDRIAASPAADLSRGDGIEEGEGTYLNTREWKHASFFNRVKQSVGQHWDPNALIALQDPTGEAYLYKDRHTLVAVTLDGSGNLRSVRVTRPSGVEFLDREALDAFRRAGPFPHPPTALQNDRGEISFSFGFYLEVSRNRLRLFR